MFKRQSAGSVFHKTQLCKFFQRGKCKMRGVCKFAHTQEELQPSPDFKFTKMCAAMLSMGFCDKGDACTFAHSAEELRTCVRTPLCPSSPAAAALSLPQRGVASPPERAASAAAAPAPPPPPAPSVLMLVQAPAAQMQALQVIPMVSMQGMLAPAPACCSEVDLGTANCAQAVGGAVPAGSGNAMDVCGPPMVLPMQGAPPLVPACRSDADLGAANCAQVLGGSAPASSGRATDACSASSLPVLGGAMPAGGGKATDVRCPSSPRDPFDVSCCKLEEEGDLELDLLSNSWNRRSTEEGPAEPTVEFDRQSSEDEDWEYVQDSTEAGGAEAFAAPLGAFETAEWALQPGVAAVLSHSYVVRKTFVEFDDEGTPGFGLRRVRSTGGDLSLAF